MIDNRFKSKNLRDEMQPNYSDDLIALSKLLQFCLTGEIVERPFNVSSLK